MSIHLFTRHGTLCTPVEPWLAPLEGDLHALFEANLKILLGVELIANEFDTGEGRMDTLGIDADGCPIIIEYKRRSKDNIINQALFYQSWLLSHQAEFERLCVQKKPSVSSIDWSGLRLICIASDFHRYDLHAIDHIRANIDLIRYRLHGPDLIALETLHTHRLPGYRANARKQPKVISPTFRQRLNHASDRVQELFGQAMDRLQHMDMPFHLHEDGKHITLVNDVPVARFYLDNRQQPRLKCEICCHPDEIRDQVDQCYQAGLDVYRKTKDGFEISIFDEQSLATTLAIIEGLASLHMRAALWG